MSECVFNDLEQCTTHPGGVKIPVGEVCTSERIRALEAEALLEGKETP